MKKPRKKVGIIYKIISPSGKVYIGKSINFTKRLRYYAKGGCKNQTVLYNSILKHGWDSHTIEVLAKSNFPTNETLNILERFFIKYYKTNLRRYPTCNGMNCTDGGDGNFGAIKTGAELERIRTLRVGKAPWNKGKTYTKELKEKLSKAHKGKYTRGDNPSAKILFDENTGVYFESVTELCENYNKCRPTIRKWIKNNDTRCKYKYV